MKLAIAQAEKGGLAKIWEKAREARSMPMTRHFRDSKACLFSGMSMKGSFKLIASSEKLDDLPRLAWALKRKSFGGSFEDDGLLHHAFAAKGRSLTFVESDTRLEFYSFEGDGLERQYREGVVTSAAMLTELVRWLEHGSPA